MTNEEKAIKEYLDNHKEKPEDCEVKTRDNSEEYQLEVMKYLTDKLGKYNVSHSDIAEMTMYLVYKAMLFSVAELRRYQKQNIDRIRRRVSDIKRGEE